MNKKGGLFTSIKEQILWTFRVPALVIFALIIIVFVGMIFASKIETENLQNKIDLFNAQKCLEKIGLSDFKKEVFAKCVGLEDAGIGLKIDGNFFYRDNFYGFFMDLCNRGYVCSEGIYFVDEKLVLLEVIRKDV